MPTTKKKGIIHNLRKVVFFLEGFIHILRSSLSDRQFIYLSCVLVSISSALAVILLKTFAHSVHTFANYIDSLLKLSYTNALLPIVGILMTVIVVRKFLDGSIEKGTSQIMIAVAKRSGYMPKKQMYAQIITSSLTVGMGGSAGLESPIAITGAAYGSNFAQNFRLNYKDRTLLLACGVASGIATAFNAPIAGVLFAIEVILADMSVSAFIPLLISSATGTIFANITLKEDILLSFSRQLSFDYGNTFFYIILGLIAGFYSIYHARMFRRIEHLIGKYSKNVYRRAMVGSMLLAILIFLFPTLFGEGYESIKMLANNQGNLILNNSLLESFKRNQWVVLAFIFTTMMIKSIATGLTLGSGGNGGNFAPSLFAGSYLGFLLSKILTILGWKDLPIDSFTVVGMAGVLSGLFHAPLTAIFLIAEITGSYGLIVPLMIVSSISFAIAKRYDKYSMDIFSIADKGVVFTSDKDQNILNKIDIERLKLDKNHLKTLRLEDNMLLAKQIFATTQQDFIPILNQNNQLVGIVYLKDVRKIVFSDFQSKFTNVSECLKTVVSCLLDDNAANVLEQMNQNQIDVIQLMQGSKWVGFITKERIMNQYRENLKNLRIE